MIRITTYAAPYVSIRLHTPSERLADTPATEVNAANTFEWLLPIPEVDAKNTLKEPQRTVHTQFWQLNE